MGQVPEGGTQTTLDPFTVSTPKTLFAVNPDTQYGLYFLLLCADGDDSFSIGDSNDPVDCANIISKIYVKASIPVAIPIPGGLWGAVGAGIVVKKTGGTTNATVTARVGRNFV